MEISEIMSFIASNGFAIFAAAYMLIIMNKNIQKQSETLAELKTLIETLNKQNRKEDEAE